MDLLNPDDRQHLLSMQTHVNSLDSFKLDLMESEHSGAGKTIVPTSTSYRPMSSVLSSRFTKAKHKDEDNVVVAGLDKKVASWIVKSTSLSEWHLKVDNSYCFFVFVSVTWMTNKLLFKWRCLERWPGKHLSGTQTNCSARGLMSQTHTQGMT